MLRHLTLATLYGDSDITTSNGPLAFIVGIIESSPGSGTIIGTDDIAGNHPQSFTFYYSTTEDGIYVPATSAQGVQNPNNVWTNGSTAGLWYKATETIGDVTSGFSNSVQSTRPPRAPALIVLGPELRATNQDPSTPQEYVFYKSSSLIPPFNYVPIVVTPSNTYTVSGPTARYSAAVIVNGITSPMSNGVVR